MAIYGSIEAVKQMLRPEDDSTFGDDEDDRLEAIQQAVSSALEQKLDGRTFGAPVADTTKLVYAGPFSTLLLPIPARSITSVTWNPTIAGGVITGGEAWASSLWEHTLVNRYGEIGGLRLLSGGYWGESNAFGQPITPVKIVGDFVDSDADASVPDEITYAVNFLIAEEFKNQNAGPGGSIGPDGNVIYPRNPWKNTLVVEAMNKYRSANRVMVF